MKQGLGYRVWGLSKLQRFESATFELRWCCEQQEVEDQRSAVRSLRCTSYSLPVKLTRSCRGDCSLFTRRPVLPTLAIELIVQNLRSNRPYTLAARGESLAA